MQGRRVPSPAVCAAVVISACSAALFPAIAEAALLPVPVTGFNQDVVVDANAPLGANVQGFITATMTSGTAKTGATWMEKGYVKALPQGGLPMGTTATGNVFIPDTFILQPANANNVLMLNDASPSGTLTLVNPAPYSQLVLFNAHEDVSVLGLPLNYTIRFVGGATETGQTFSSHWYTNPALSAAYNGSGRVKNVQTGEVDSVGETGPFIYENSIPLVNTGTAVQSIEFFRPAHSGNAVIFAVGGTPEPGSLALLGVGASVMGLLRRRRRGVRR
jgi:hypothetical protein